MMLVALDTNSLVYEAGLHDPVRRDRALDIRISLGADRAVIATQVLGEFFHVLVAKMKWQRDRAKLACDLLCSGAAIRAADETTFSIAFSLAAGHGLHPGMPSSYAQPPTPAASPSFRKTCSTASSIAA